MVGVSDYLRIHQIAVGTAQLSMGHVYFDPVKESEPSDDDESNDAPDRNWTIFTTFTAIFTALSLL